jgi:hypothetical protein
MVQAKATDDQFISAWRRHGTVVGVTQELGMHPRTVQRRREKLANQGHDLPTLARPGYEATVPQQYQPGEGWTFPREKRLWIDTGSVVVFSDCHYWPGEPSIAHRALIEVIRTVKPRVAIANGDVFDGGSIGRHPPFGFSTRPTPVQELHACQERLGEVEQVMPNGSELLWNLGNHDIRWERTLATQAEQFAGLHGLRLADHFPAWEFQWSTLINVESAGPVMVKHRFANGIHAAYNNTMKGGLSIVTGHTHHLEVKPYVDYRGRRYGVQCGSCSDLASPQFEYTENSPSPACSGFAVLTFRDGRLLAPELCEVVDGAAWFRGEPVA